MDERKKQNREHYQDYRKELGEIFVKSNELYEKQISYISAGALGLTFLLLEHIIKDVAGSQLKALLVLSWIFLSLTLLINLVSHNFVSEMMNKSMSEIDNGEFDDTVCNNRNRKIRILNYFTTTLLIFGISFFVIYTSYNITHMGNNTNNSDYSEKGLSPTPAPPSVDNRPKPSTGVSPSPAPPPPTPVKKD